MHQKFHVEIDSRAEVWTVNDGHHGFAVALSLNDRVESVSCQMTPDQALAMAESLERAAFITRRSQSIGAELAEAETAFVALRTAQAVREVAGVSAHAENVIKGDAVSPNGVVGVHKAKVLQPIADAHVFAQASGADGAVNLPIGAKDGNVHVVAAAAIGVSFCIDHGGNVCIVRERGDAGHESGVHVVLSEGDRQQMRLVAKYLAKAAEVAA